MTFAFRRLAVVAIAAASLALPAAAQDWVEHKPAGAGFRVEMPSAPKVSTQDVPTAAGPIKTTLAIVDRGNAAFIVSYNDYPAAALAGRTPDQILDGVVQGQVGKNTLRDDRKIAISERAARAVVIENAQGQVIVSRSVMVETRLYQALFVGLKGSEASPDAQKFLDSFALVAR